MKTLLIQGANMEYLGFRQPELYGRTTAAELDALCLAEAEPLGLGEKQGVELGGGCAPVELRLAKAQVLHVGDLDEAGFHGSASCVYQSTYATR